MAKIHAGMLSLGTSPKDRYIVAVNGSTRDVLDCTMDWDLPFPEPLTITVTVLADDGDFATSLEPLCEVYDRENGVLYVFDGKLFGYDGTAGGPIRAQFTNRTPIRCFDEDAPRECVLADRLALPEPALAENNRAKAERWREAGMPDGELR